MEPDRGRKFGRFNIKPLFFECSSAPHHTFRWRFVSLCNCGVFLIKLENDQQLNIIKDVKAPPDETPKNSTSNKLLAGQTVERSDVKKKKVGSMNDGEKEKRQKT